MKHNTLLTVASLLSLLFLTLHITDDIVRGTSKAESSNVALAVLAVFLYGTLVLPERRSGHIIILLIGLLAAAMPVMHMRGAHYGEIAQSPGGFFFVWVLWMLGGLGRLHNDPRSAWAVGICDEGGLVVQRLLCPQSRPCRSEYYEVWRGEDSL